MKEKFIDFIITQKCTYNCVYCSQSKNETKIKKSADENTIKNFLNFLNHIEKDFEITITGGEAILHHSFIDLIKQIKQKGFKINLITNFSFDIEKYKEIFETLNETLINYDISFHLDEIKKQYKDIDSLIRKLENFIALKPNSMSINFLIPIFNLNDEKHVMIEKLVSFAKENGINYSFQRIRFLNNYVDKYSQEKYFKKCENKNSYSYLCHAGSKSAVVYENGDVFRCYSSRFLKTNYLGNINDKNFMLNLSPEPCVFKNCGCPKPVIYNQLTNIKDIKKTIVYNILNFVWFPFLFFKNSDIVKSKISQFFKLKG